MIVPYVLEKSNQNLSGYDLYSRLLKDRIVFFGSLDGEVNTASANSIIAQLLYLDGEDPEKPINFYINSPGGSVSAGLAIYDTMQYIKAPVYTICMGMAMSFGAVLLAAGSKGKRFALPNARIMIHQVRQGYGVGGTATDIEIENQEMQHLKKILTEIMARHTGQPFEKVHQDMEHDFYMSAEEAKAYGIIDEVLAFRKKI
ncbi:MAG: ATP-dependent Clp protease proteolytic subunit [Elusimicrobiales bacterium]|nr:ATP-dependent Clp protease proteolytic subunit [Elusimicrobiales bacterium]